MGRRSLPPLQRHLVRGICVRLYAFWTRDWMGRRRCPSSGDISCEVFVCEAFSAFLDTERPSQSYEALWAWHRKKHRAFLVRSLVQGFCITFGHRRSPGGDGCLSARPLVRGLAREVLVSFWTPKKGRGLQWGFVCEAFRVDTEKDRTCEDLVCEAFSFFGHRKRPELQETSAQVLHAMKAATSEHGWAPQRRAWEIFLRLVVVCRRDSNSREWDT
jgi:hypothetical protein